MDERCCRGVPAALQPVQTGSHGPCVTVCVVCAAPGPAVDMSSTSRASARCAAARLDTCAKATCTHCPVLAHVAGSVTILAGIDRSINPEQLGSLPPFQSAWITVYDGSCGQRRHTPAWQSFCQCSASAFMVKPRCMCFWGGHRFLREEGQISFMYFFYISSRTSGRFLKISHFSVRHHPAR